MDSLTKKLSQIENRPRVHSLHTLPLTDYRWNTTCIAEQLLEEQRCLETIAKVMYQDALIMARAAKSRWSARSRS